MMAKISEQKFRQKRARALQHIATVLEQKMHYNFMRGASIRDLTIYNTRAYRECISDIVYFCANKPLRRRYEAIVRELGIEEAKRGT